MGHKLLPSVLRSCASRLTPQHATHIYHHSCHHGAAANRVHPVASVHTPCAELPLFCASHRIAKPVPPPPPTHTHTTTPHAERAIRLIKLGGQEQRHSSDDAEQNDKAAAQGLPAAGQQQQAQAPAVVSLEPVGKAMAQLGLYLKVSPACSSTVPQAPATVLHTMTCIPCVRPPVNSTSQTLCHGTSKPRTQNP
jgi:hypothetical protein